MSIVDALNEIWNTILEITAMFVIPDWGALIGLMPLLIFLGVVGPLLTFLSLGHHRLPGPKPRTKVELRRGPAGRPSSTRTASRSSRRACRSAGRDALIYPSGTIRCDRCGDELRGHLPDVRPGPRRAIDTCTNCGLVLKVKNRARPGPSARRPEAAAAPPSRA